MRNTYVDYCCPSHTLKRQVSSSKKAITRELSLQNMVYRQRIQTIALLGLLTSEQQMFVNRLSKLFIEEYTDSDSSSDDAEQ